MKILKNIPVNTHQLKRTAYNKLKPPAKSETVYEKSDRICIDLVCNWNVSDAHTSQRYRTHCVTGMCSGGI